MKILLTTFNAKYVHSSLSLYSLRANVPEEYDVQLLEMTINMPFMTCMSEVAARKPDILMFSLYIWNRERTLNFIREIRKILPEVQIFLGGPEATGQGARILDEVQEIAGIFIGEGEGTFREFCNRLHEDRTLSGLPGLMLREEDFTPRAYLEMDSLQFPYREVDLEANREKLIYYESSRGCPFSCAYCLSSLEKRTRYKSLERVYGEIKRLLSYKPQTIKFVDRTFNLDSKRTKYMLRFIQELAPEGTCFHFEVSADLFDEEILAILEEMPDNLVQLEVGLQSTNLVTLKHCGRRTDVEKIRKNLLRLVIRENIHIHLDLIAGLPEEDFISFEKSFSDALAMRPHMLQLGFLKLLPGSLMEANKDAFGIVSQDTPPYEVLKTDVLSFDDLCALKRAENAVDGFYNSNIMRNLMNIMPNIYPGGALQFFIDLEGHYEAGTNSPYKGMIRRFYAVWTMIREIRICARVEHLQEILLLDYCLLTSKKFIPDFLLESKDHQTMLTEAMSSDGELLSMIHELTDGRSLKETFKNVRLLSVSHECCQQVRLLSSHLKKDGAVGKPVDGIWNRLSSLEGIDESRCILLLDYRETRGIFAVPNILNIH